jgi:hypothetical protein
VRQALLLSLALAAACGGSQRAINVVRSDSSGVEIVMNPGPDRTLTFPVTASDTIIDPAVDTTLQGEARGVQVGADATGRLVFVDGGSADRRVLRQEQDGSIHQVGRRGGGPGEYEMVGGVAVAPSGEVIVGDYSKQGFVRFDPAGQPLPLLKWSEIGPGFSRNAGFAAGGMVIQLHDYGRGAAMQQTLHEGEESQGPSPTQTLYYVRATDTAQVARVTDPPMKMIIFEACRIGFSQTPLFHPSLLWTGNAEMLAVVSDGGYRVDIWRDGRFVRNIRRDFTPRNVTRAMAEQEVGEGMRVALGGGPPCLIPASEIIAKQGFAPVLPAIKRISMANDGTLWVERWTIRGEPMQHDLFDSTGAYLGTLAGDIPWPQAWLPDGRYVSVGADADSLPVVVRYAVGGGVRAE